MLRSIEDFIQNGSNYQLYAIKCIKEDIDIYKPLGGSSYIDLPAFIKNKQCCINVKNKDDKCFAWSILSCINPIDRKNHPDRISSYNQDEFLKLDQILINSSVTYPFKPDERIVQKVEKRLDTSINIYTYDITSDGYDRYPIVITKKTKNKTY